MNSYAITAKFLTELFEANPLVNTVIFGADMDINKTNIFPLVHIFPGEMSMADNRLEMTFEIAVVNQRQTPNHSQMDKIFGNNLIDNLNLTSAILTQEITKIEMQYNDFDITIASATPAQPIIYADKNVLDGFECTLVLSIQNIIETCQ